MDAGTSFVSLRHKLCNKLYLCFGGHDGGRERGKEGMSVLVKMFPPLYSHSWKGAKGWACIRDKI